MQSLSGVPFPSGSGLVTKCPTQLILTKSASNIPWKAKVTVNYREQGKPQPPGTGPVSSVQDLCEIITKLTNVLTKGVANSFSSDMIVIELSSPESPDLTIIDLPGIIRTTTNGQNMTVVREINDLIDSYIIQENTIILAVIPSNQDIATIDILERASRGDPTGARTLGVLTKPDLIGDGNEEEIVQVLSNIRKPLLLGYVMVKNLNQKEVGIFRLALGLVLMNVFYMLHVQSDQSSSTTSFHEYWHRNSS